MQPAVDEERGGVFLDIFWEVGGDLDEVDEEPDSALVVRSWIFDRVNLVAAERWLGLKSCESDPY
jgi:hypothetical protein